MYINIKVINILIISVVYFNLLWSLMSKMSTLNYTTINHSWSQKQYIHYYYYYVIDFSSIFLSKL